MLLEITSLSLFLNTIQILIDGIVFNDRFEYVYFRWFSALRQNSVLFIKSTVYNKIFN